MTICRALDVVVGLFPFIDTPQRKPRPLLVISTSEFNLAHDQLVGAMITTGRDSQWPSDVPINDLEEAGLRHPSVIRMKMFTLPRFVIATRIGALSAGDGLRLQASVRQTLV